MRYRTYSFRFAEEVLNGKLVLKKEIEDIITSLKPDYKKLSRPYFNTVLNDEFGAKGWETQPLVFNEPGDPTAKMDFLKERIGIEVEFGHPSFLGIDLLKFQVSSYSSLDKIDVGVYIAATSDFKKSMIAHYDKKWRGSITFEKIIRYLPHFKSAIQVPVWVVGIEP